MVKERGHDNDTPRQFEKLTATHLYCNTCGCSMPVRERLLLILPDGELYEYRCSRCHSPVGTRRATTRRSF